jgi:hypothetical protein
MEREPTPERSRVLLLDGIVRGLCLALTALLPFFVIPFSFVTVPQSKVLLLAMFFSIAVVVWGIARVIEGVVAVPRSIVLYASALLPIAYLASAAATGWTGVSIIGQGIEQDTLASVVLMSAVFCIITMAFSVKNELTRVLLKTMVYGSLALFIAQILYLLAPTWFSFGILQGPTANLLGSWHDLGILAGLMLFLSFALFPTDYFKGIERITLGILGVTSAFLLTVIHFTDLFWAVCALFSITLIVRIIEAYRREGTSMLEIARENGAIAGVAILCGVIAQFGTPYFEKIPEIIRINQTEVRPSWQGTFDVARQSLQEPVELFFGAGPNSFIREWGRHKPEGVNATPFWDSDFNTGVGSIPTSIFTSGIVGLIAWTALILVIVGFGAKYLFEVYVRHRMHFSVLGVVLMSVGYLLAYHRNRPYRTHFSSPRPLCSRLHFERATSYFDRCEYIIRSWSSRDTRCAHSRGNHCLSSSVT